MFKKYDKNIIKASLHMAVPSMIESFFIAFTNLIDSYMVSSLGAGAVASVGLTSQPKMVGFAIFMAMNVAISALVARRFGEKKRSDANGIVITAILMIFILSITLSILFVVFASPIMRLCGSNSETHSGAVIYYRIIMGAMIFNCIQIGVNAAQRGAGNTKITMRTHLSSNTVNIIFNYLLINGHLGFPALGITGAAIATVLGTVVACIMSIISIMKPSGFISIPYIIRSKILPSYIYFKNIIKVAYSMFFEQLLMRIGFMATSVMAAHQGTASMAVHQVGMNFLGLSFSFGDGLQAAAVALIGRSLGEKKPDLAKSYGASCQMIGGVISVFVAILYFFGARFLMQLFFAEKSIVDLGVHVFYMAVFVVLFQIRQSIYIGCLRGAGDTLYTAIITTTSITVIRTFFSYLGSYVLLWGIVGVWLGILADQVVRFVWGAIRFKSGKWTNIKI